MTHNYLRVLEIDKIKEGGNERTVYQRVYKRKLKLVLRTIKVEW